MDKEVLAHFCEIRALKYKEADTGHQSLERRK
jgi:hypothetical protein